MNAQLGETKLKHKCKKPIKKGCDLWNEVALKLNENCSKTIL